MYNIPKKFSEEEISLLKRNPYIRRVTKDRIGYDPSFYEYFIEKYRKGSKPTEIFREVDLPPELIGEKRIERFADRCRKRYKVDVLEQNRNGFLP